MYNKEYYIEKDFETKSKLMQRNIKTQVLNSIKQRINEMQLETEDTVILDALDVHLRLIEDAYVIDMYKFQFKLFVNILNKELSNLEEMILYEE